MSVLNKFRRFLLNNESPAHKEGKVGNRLEHGLTQVYQVKENSAGADASGLKVGAFKLPCDLRLIKVQAWARDRTGAAGSAQVDVQIGAATVLTALIDVDTDDTHFTGALVEKRDYDKDDVVEVLVNTEATTGVLDDLVVTIVGQQIGFLD